MSTPSPSDEAVAWIRQHWKDKLVCEACGHDDWGIAELLAVPVSHNAKPTLSAHMPVFPVVCTTCGNTKFLSYRLMRGLVGTSQPSGKPQ